MYHLLTRAVSCLDAVNSYAIWWCMRIRCAYGDCLRHFAQRPLVILKAWRGFNYTEFLVCFLFGINIYFLRCFLWQDASRSFGCRFAGAAVSLWTRFYPFPIRIATRKRHWYKFDIECRIIVTAYDVYPGRQMGPRSSDRIDASLPPWIPVDRSVRACTIS